VKVRPGKERKACRCPWHFTEDMGGQATGDPCTKSLIELVRAVRAEPLNKRDLRRSRIMRQRYEIVV
jgi:hypothetical protein